MTLMVSTTANPFYRCSRLYDPLGRGGRQSVGTALGIGLPWAVKDGGKLDNSAPAHWTHGFYFTDGGTTTGRESYEQTERMSLGQAPGVPSTAVQQKKNKCFVTGVGAGGMLASLWEQCGNCCLGEQLAGVSREHQLSSCHCTQGNRIFIGIPPSLESHPGYLPRLTHISEESLRKPLPFRMTCAGHTGTLVSHSFHS